MEYNMRNGNIWQDRFYDPVQLALELVKKQTLIRIQGMLNGHLSCSQTPKARLSYTPEKEPWKRRKNARKNLRPQEHM